MGPPLISDEELIRFILSGENLKDGANEKIALAYYGPNDLSNRIKKLKKILNNLEEKSIKLEKGYTEIIDSISGKTNFIEVLQKHENLAVIKDQEKFKNSSIPPQSYALDGFIHYKLEGIKLKVVCLVKKSIKSNLFYIENGSIINEYFNAINISIESLKTNSFLKINRDIYEIKKNIYTEFKLASPINEKNQITIVPYDSINAKVISFNFFVKKQVY